LTAHFGDVLIHRPSQFLQLQSAQSYYRCQFQEVKPFHNEILRRWIECHDLVDAITRVTQPDDMLTVKNLILSSQTGPGPPVRGLTELGVSDQSALEPWLFPLRAQIQRLEDLLELQTSAFSEFHLTTKTEAFITCPSGAASHDATSQVDAAFMDAAMRRFLSRCHDFDNQLNDRRVEFSSILASIEVCFLSKCRTITGS